MNASENWVTLSDGMEIYTKTWGTDSPPIAHIFFIHGFSDHCNTYPHFAQTVTSLGIEFHSFDQRGWGRTCVRANAKEPHKTTRHNGLSGGTSQVFSDMTELLTLRLAARPNVPCFLVGHSMGGGLVLTYAISGALKDSLAGVVVWSPMVELAKGERINSIKLGVLKLGALVLPDKQIVQHLPPENMSRDPAVVEEFRNDELCHDTGTLIGYADMLGRGAHLKKREFVREFDAGRPVLVVHGSGDKVTDYDASRGFVKSLSQVTDKEFKTFDGWFHKLHAEPGDDKFVFARYVASWITQRSGGGGGGGAVAGGSSKL